MATYRKQLIAALAVGAIAVGSLAYFSRTPSTSQAAAGRVRIVEDPRPPREWAINAAYGRGALSNLRAAFVELENHNAEQARMGIVVARSLLTKIAPVKTSQSGPPTGDGSLVFVHSEVRVLDDIEGEQAVESKLDRIRREVDMSDSEAVIAALRELKVPMMYTRIDLPLQETISGIDHVLEALNSDDTERASAMLANIGNGLHVDTVKIESRVLPPIATTDDGAG